MFVTSFCVSWRNSINAFVMRLEVFWYQQQSLGSFWNHVSFVELLHIPRRCANLVVAHCFRCNFVFSCARTRADMDRCVSMREYKFVCVYGGACLRLFVHTYGRWCMCVRFLVICGVCVLCVYLCVFACTFVRVLSRADPFDAHFCLHLSISQFGAVSSLPDLERTCH